MNEEKEFTRLFKEYEHVRNRWVEYMKEQNRINFEKEQKEFFEKL